jgi:hypothetical protein
MLNYSNIIYDSENFLSQEEVLIIRKEVHESKHLWRNVLEYESYRAKLNNRLDSNIFIDFIKMLKNDLFDVSIDSNITVLLESLQKHFKINFDMNLNISIEDFECVINLIKNTEYVDQNLIDQIFLIFNEHDNRQQIFGDAIYLIGGKLEVIDWKIQSELQNKFDWLYAKLLQRIENICQKKVEMDKNLPAPGFHIFCNKTRKLSEYHYHIDSTICDFYPHVDTKDIHSFVSLIQSPKIKPFLDYKFGFKEYEYGSLHFWKGDMVHRIGSFSLDDEEYRITLQGHMFHDRQTDVIKVYF